MTLPLVFEVEVDSRSAAIQVDSPQVSVTPSDPVVIFAVVPGPQGNTGPAGDGAQVFNETPSGDIDGTNVTFATVSHFQAGTTAVYLNGLRQLSGADYEESTGAIAFSDAPQPGDLVTIDYIIHP